MTFDAALNNATAALDRVIERNRQRFERSLVENHCPAEDVEDLRAYERDHAQTCRAHALAEIRERLLAEAPAYTVH